MDKYECPNTLCERDSDGIRVELRFLPIVSLVGIYVTTPQNPVGAWASVDPANAMDAFQHPFCYLSPASAATLVAA